MALTKINGSMLDSAAGSASAGRSALGLVPGTDVQAYDADLSALAGLTSAANKIPYFTGSGTAAVADFTAAGRALVDDADAAEQRATLGLGSIATFAEATAAQFHANTAGKALSTDKVWSAADLVTLTDGATVTADLSTGFNFILTLAGNRTMAAPTNTKNGQSGVILVKQDATGSRTLSWNSAWKWTNGTAPTLTTVASRTDKVYYFVESSTIVHASIEKDSR